MSKKPKPEAAKPKRCAIVDERGVYQGMVEVGEDDTLTERHLPAIASCDLKPGTARWKADEKNPYGGAFEPLPAQQIAKAGAPTMEMALVFQLLQVWNAGGPVAQTALQWLDATLQTWDLAPFHDQAVVQAYAQARGLKLFKKKGE